VIRWRLAQPGEWAFAWVWFAAAVAAPLLAWAWLRLGTPTPGCAFHRLTGYPCPTCGSTRAVVALLAGRPLRALSWNPLTVLAMGAFEIGGIAAPLWLAAGGRVPVLEGRLPWWARFGALALVLLNWVYLVVRRV